MNDAGLLSLAKTLSLWECLSELIPTLRQNAVIHELGCGPYAALALKKKYTHINISASDIDSGQVSTAKQNAASSRLPIKLIQSDLLLSVGNKVDLILMNPHYVSTSQQQNISGKKSENSAEWKSGYGGNDGMLVIRRLLTDAHFALTKSGLLALGINNFFISDDIMRGLFVKYVYRIVSVFKKHKESIPLGVFA